MQACADIIKNYKESGKKVYYRVSLEKTLIPVEDTSFPARLIPKGTTQKFKDRHEIKSGISFTGTAELEGGVDLWISQVKAGIKATVGTSYEETRDKIRSVELVGTGKPLVVSRRILHRTGHLIATLGFKQIKIPFSYPEDFELIVRESE